MGDIIDPGVPDIYADNVGAVEIIGNGANVRVIYYSWQGTGPDRIKVAVAKIVFPRSAICQDTISRLVSEQERTVESAKVVPLQIAH